MYLPFLLSWRYLRGATHEKSISLMVIICFLGIMIGTFSLTLIVSVMRGFEKVTHEKLQGIHAQVAIRSADGDPLNIEALIPVLKKEFPAIIATSPSTMQQGIIQSDGTGDINNVVAIKGIDPESEARTTDLEKKIISSMRKEKTLQATIDDTHVIIGKKLAESLAVTPGDHVSLLTVDDAASAKNMRLTKHDLIVGGIFSTGIDEFDSNVVIGSLSMTEQLFPNTGITHVHAKLKPEANEYNVISALRTRLTDLDIYSWKDLYPALVSALKLETITMFFILALITLVASMNIISLLFMQITKKLSDIALLKSMGMNNGPISTIFLLMGTGIALAGSVLGIGLAVVAAWFLQHYPFITLPDAYFVTTLPVSMEWSIVLIVFVVVMGLSILATWLPTRRTRSINIASILRFEA